MAFGLDDIFSWIGDTAGSVGQGVSDAAGAVGQGVSDVAGSIGQGADSAINYLTSAFGSDPGSAQFPGIPAGGESTAFMSGESIPQIAGAGAGGYNPDFSGLNAAGGGASGLPSISPSTPILAGGVPDTTGNLPINANAVAGGGGNMAGDSSGISGMLKNNASWLLPAAGIGMAGLKSQAQLPGTNALKANAATLNAAAGPLMAPLTTGSALPPGAQAGLDASAAAMTASIKSRHASSGTAGSSMEAQELASVPLMIQQQKLVEAQGLYTTGLQTLGMADSATQSIMQTALQQDATLTNALARMAASMAPTALKDLTKGN